MAENYYTPGVCNINPTETAYRRKFAIGLGAAGVVLLVLGLLAQVHPAVGIVLFLPFWLSSVNILQSRNHFCVAYASSGKYNNGDGMGAVADATAEQHAKDKAKARTMNLQALGMGVVATVISCALLALAV